MHRNFSAFVQRVCSGKKSLQRHFKLLRIVNVQTKPGKCVFQLRQYETQPAPQLIMHTIILLPLQTKDSVFTPPTSDIR